MSSPLYRVFTIGSGSFPGVNRPGRGADPHPYFQCRGLKQGRAIPLPTVRALVAYTGGTFPFFIQGVYSYIPERHYVCFQGIQCRSSSVVKMYRTCNVIFHDEHLVFLHYYLPQQLCGAQCGCFLQFLISCFSRNVLNGFEVILFFPVITVVICVFASHVLTLSVVRYLYFQIVSVFNHIYYLLKL